MDICQVIAGASEGKIREFALAVLALLVDEEGWKLNLPGADVIQELSILIDDTFGPVEKEA